MKLSMDPQKQKGALILSRTGCLTVINIVSLQKFCTAPEKDSSQLQIFMLSIRVSLSIFDELPQYVFQRMGQSTWKRESNWFSSCFFLSPLK